MLSASTKLCQDVHLTDLEKMAEIESQLFGDPWTPTMLYAEFANKSILSRKLVIDENIMGYHFTLLIPPEAELHNIAVRQASQGNGFGRILLEDSLELSRSAECQTVFLEVRESNVAARSLYESMHFKIVGKRERYYNMHTEDAILYRWDA